MEVKRKLAIETGLSYNNVDLILNKVIFEAMVMKYGYRYAIENKEIINQIMIMLSYNTKLEIIQMYNVL